MITLVIVTYTHTSRKVSITYTHITKVSILPRHALWRGSHLAGKAHDRCSRNISPRKIISPVAQRYGTTKTLFTKNTTLCPHTVVEASLYTLWPIYSYMKSCPRFPANQSISFVSNFIRKQSVFYISLDLSKTRYRNKYRSNLTGKRTWLLCYILLFLEPWQY